ncbi:hypothetical protein MCUN1_002269 [Malassezia cuniculi]|uniref:Zinc-regulated transporter 1 n=1 Tax=Malassezia cuniculi TaxID=948313 RepID=A0AAF0J6T9_9BASI|nr:hypothetical protein MCUN1_002269 [Malassezia cuniculi]
MDSEEALCTGHREEVDNVGLRIGAIFIMFASSAFFTVLPIFMRRFPSLRAPEWVFDMLKYFGSGVIIATSLIHLLEPATDALSAPCLNSDFQEYPMAYAFCLISMMVLFMSEFFAYRLGTRILGEKAVEGHHHAAGHIDAVIEAHDHEHGLSHADHAHHYNHNRHHQNMAVHNDDDIRDDKEKLLDDESDIAPVRSQDVTDASEIVGVFVLEFGVIFHSVIIGLTLATTPMEGDHGESFKVLFPVIVFHQLFEGIGLGSRLSYLPPTLGAWLPLILAFAYSIVTPVGMAIGLGLRESYTHDSPTGYYVTGIFDAISAGILLYTGLVELLAHDFIFSDKMRKAPLYVVAINMLEVCVGIAIMALLGKWA